MDVLHDPQTDVDFDDFSESAPAPVGGRRARRLSARRRRRLRLAGMMAVAGVAALTAGLVWHPGSDKPRLPAPQPPATAENGTVTENTAKPPTDGPGGVGANPQRSGLPAVSPGGRVRTGTKEEGCFSTMREYLDAWDRAGEADPCFTSQEPAGQSQPGGVVRSYNGEKF